MITRRLLPVLQDWELDWELLLLMVVSITLIRSGDVKRYIYVMNVRICHMSQGRRLQGKALLSQATNDGRLRN